MPHALVFPTTVDEPPLDTLPKDGPEASAALPLGGGVALPPDDANPPGQANGSPDSTLTAATPAGLAAAMAALLLAI